MLLHCKNDPDTTAIASMKFNLLETKKIHSSQSLSSFQIVFRKTTILSSKFTSGKSSFTRT